MKFITKINNSFLYIFLILFTIIFSSCKRDNNKTNPKLSQDYTFSNWLRKHNLEEKMFTDSSKTYAFELWYHTSPLIKSDSINFREPSTDSSYILISNFNNKKYQIENLDYYSFGFLPKNDHNFFIGIGVKNEYQKNKIIDYHWINDSAFAILSSETESKSTIYNLMKLKIQVDSIWIYKTK